MERYKNIFFNIVKNETSLSEVLCNMMMYKSFRNAFLEFIKDKNKEFDIDIKDIKHSNFETEKDFGFIESEENKPEENKRLGRGDLILDFKGREYIFEIKIEIYTATTDNQPWGYFEYLEKIKGQSRDDLFFLLPKNYIFKNKLSEVNPNNIFYWEDFIEQIKDKGLEDTPYIKDFIDILNYRWFYSEKFGFSQYEKEIIANKRKVKMDDKIVPQIMMDLMHKVDLIKNRYSHTDNKNEFEYGIMIKNEKKEPILWFGIDFKFWKEKGFPLTIGIDESDIQILDLLNKEYKNEIIRFEYEKGYFFNYIALPLDEYDDTEKIVNKINEVKNILGLEES